VSDVRLAWALDGRGDVVFASSMVGVDPRDRPRVTCPECDDVVTLKAGERGIVSPHVAHRSGAACAATAPETAAHLNAKMRLVRELSARGALRLRSECRMGHHVAGDWHAPAWARAVPELKVDARRPDVALLDEGGAVVGAVEVLHSHRVDRAKALDLAASGVPWVEFRAEDVLAWDGSSPLAFVNCDRETRRQLARGCRACPKPAVFSAEEIAAREAYAAWYDEARKRPLPELNIAAAHASWRRQNGVYVSAVAAKVCAPDAKVRVAFASDNVVTLALGFSASLHALRLLASSPKARPAAIWIAGESEGIDSLSAPPGLWSLSRKLLGDAMDEFVELLAKTGSVIVRASRRSLHRHAVDCAERRALDHARFGEMEGTR